MVHALKYFMTMAITSGVALQAAQKRIGRPFVEIWNLVFMQYEQFEGGSRKPLAAQSIDTGMGIERVAALLQGTNDNYATDLSAQLN